MSVSVGAPAPDLAMTALIDDQVRRIHISDYIGRWVAIYFYPKDDTPVCRTEHEAFRSAADEFEKLEVTVLTASVDSVESHRRWRDEGLGALPFPWIADEEKRLAESFGVIHGNSGLALRATFLIDPDGIVRFASVHDLPTGRSTTEILRTLQALQTHRPTQCNWQPGEPPL